jgi:hypothetical protein
MKTRSYIRKQKYFCKELTGKIANILHKKHQVTITKSGSLNLIKMKTRSYSRKQKYFCKELTGKIANILPTYRKVLRLNDILKIFVIVEQLIEAIDMNNIQLLDD